MNNAIICYYSCYIGADQDNQNVSVTRSGGGGAFTSGFVEIVGQVTGDHAMSEMRTTAFGDEFDLDNYNAAITLLNGQYRHLVKEDQ